MPPPPLLDVDAAAPLVVGEPGSAPGAIRTVSAQVPAAAAALEKIDPRLIEAAGDLYASPATAFRKVTWPLSMPGVVAGTLLTFIPAAGDYINAALLGSTGNRMIGNAIQINFIQFRDYPTASALSFVLMAIILVLVFTYIRRAGTEELV